MHNLVDLMYCIADGVSSYSHKRTKLLAVTEMRPNFRTFVVLVNHGEDVRGTRYLVLVENGQAIEVRQLPWLTPAIVWQVDAKEKSA